MQHKTILAPGGTVHYWISKKKMDQTALSLRME